MVGRTVPVSRGSARTPRLTVATALSNRLLDQTRLERLGQRGAVQIFSDEHERVRARFTGRPVAIELRVEKHVHALENESFVRALHAKHTFHPVKIAALHAEQLADPVVEPFAVEFARCADTD